MKQRRSPRLRPGHVLPNGSLTATSHVSPGNGEATPTVSVRGQEVHLTPSEFNILAVLLREPGRVFSRSQLVEQGLGFNYEGMDRTVDVHVLNLRRKIELDPNRPEHLRTVYGVGYKFGS